MRILWLDNDVNYLMPYVGALKAEGFEVTVVRSVGEAAFRLADPNGGRYNLLILDVMIPSKNESEEADYTPEETGHGYRTGLVFYRRRKKELAEAGTKVLVLTVMLGGEVLNDFIAEGLPAENYATKYSLRAMPTFRRRIRSILYGMG
ncbi:MAG: hypothetical protein JOZ02_11810 [Acidobacteria bacterium]|nr:hypothetical protein [Acidobacteriota bacterium]